MKERLTGAIILVALIVLLVPELLTGPLRAKPAATSSTSASPSDGAAQAVHAQPPLRSYTLTLSAAPQPVHDASSAPAQAAAQPVASPTPTAPPSAAHSPGETPGAPAHSDLQAVKSAAHPLVPVARSSGPGGGWVVQLGSFASRRNADRLARSLEGRGFRMSVSSARTGTRTLWRVRAGPAHDRAGAQHLAGRLQALGHRGELLPVK
ncbi:MAG: SPOR domain-containing protein [Steroidobacteraceae bacterium]